MAAAVVQIVRFALAVVIMQSALAACSGAAVPVYNLITSEFVAGCRKALAVTAFAGEPAADNAVTCLAVFAAIVNVILFANPLIGMLARAAFGGFAFA